ncbi:MAG: PAS domain-containing protein [Gemmatimonadaceae bacterium]|nr:PAS domain-containing protein [Gemmatimonadaceae bacterium]
MSHSDVSTAVHPLAVVADIAARIASGDDVVSKTSDILDRLLVAFAAPEVGLWLYGPSGLVCSLRAGEAQTTGEEVGTLLDAGGGSTESLIVRRLVAGSRRLGAIALRLGSPLSADAVLAVGTVANMLAPELSRAEQLRHLEGEVERRTRQLDEEKRFIDQIVDSLPLGLYVIDREYRVQAWNRKRETGMQGISREQALGRTIFEILHRAPAESLRQEFDEVFRTGRIQQFNIESRASGETRTFRITKIPMRASDAAITHVITIGEDVTDWTVAQERFAQSEKLAAIGQLAAGVMHEVNNPLATISACAESLSLRLDDMRDAGVEVPPQSGEFLRIIDTEVQRCKRIVDGLLDFSRPRSGEKSVTGVNDVVEQSVFLVKHHARFKKLKLQTLLDPALPLVDANAEQLIQVFMALMINAADAMEHEGTITVRTRAGSSPHEQIIAEVIDEGPGIAGADLPKIFDPFFTTKAPGRGTGLGLSICYGIITDHGGRIEVDSAVGAGSTFRIFLPAMPAT